MWKLHCAGKKQKKTKTKQNKTIIQRKKRQKKNKNKTNKKQKNKAKKQNETKRNKTKNKKTKTKTRIALSNQRYIWFASSRRRNFFIFSPFINKTTAIKFDSLV